MSSENTLSATLRRIFRLENRRAAIRPGRLERIPFISKILGAQRDLTVYLPAGYDEREDRRYPVLYMHDGQNLFEAHRAFIPGNHWRLAEAADDVIGTRLASPMMIVGIDNGGARRIDEYTPTRDVARNIGGRARDHTRMLLEEIKPLIDARFRTYPEETGIGGSSLGGLVSLALLLDHPDTFTRAAIMSPSVWWTNRVILDKLDRYDRRVRPRIWLDIGGREGTNALEDARTLRDRLVARGWTLDMNLRFYEDRRGDHSERAWARRSKPMLEFLFPAT